MKKSAICMIVLVVITGCHKIEKFEPVNNRFIPPKGGVVHFYDSDKDIFDYVEEPYEVSLEFESNQVSNNTLVEFNIRDMFCQQNVWCADYPGVSENLEKKRLSRNYFWDWLNGSINDSIYYLPLGNSLSLLPHKRFYEFNTSAQLTRPVKVTLHNYNLFNWYEYNVAYMKSLDMEYLHPCYLNFNSQDSTIVPIDIFEIDTILHRVTFEIKDLTRPFGLCYIDSFALVRKDSFYLKITDTSYVKNGGTLQDYNNKVDYLGLCPVFDPDKWQYTTLIYYTGPNTSNHWMYSDYNYNYARAEISFNDLAVGYYDNNDVKLRLDIFKTEYLNDLTLNSTEINYTDSFYAVNVKEFGPIGGRIRGDISGIMKSEGLSLQVDGWFSFTRTR